MDGVFVDGRSCSGGDGGGGGSLSDETRILIHADILMFFWIDFLTFNSASRI